MRGKKVGARLNLYVATTDRELFRRAEEYATREGVSLSSVIAQAVAEYMKTRE